MYSPDPTLYPTLDALRAVLSIEQWNALFANRLAKRSAIQMLLKHRQQPTTGGELNRLVDALADEMRAFRPIKHRTTGEHLVL